MRFLPAAALLLAAQPAVSQSVAYIGAELNYLEFSDETATFDGLGTRVGADLGILGITVSGTTYADRYSEAGVEAVFTTSAASLGYSPLPGTLVGLGLRDLTVEVDGMSGTANFVEGFAQIELPFLGLAAVHRTSDDLFDDYSETGYYGELSYGIALTYGAALEFTSEQEAFNYALTADLDLEGIELRGFLYGTEGVDEAFIGVRGRYAVGRNGGYALTSWQHYLDDEFDDHTVILGGGWKVTEAAAIEAGVGQFWTNDDSADLVSFNLSYDLGKRARIDQRFEEARRRDGYYGLTVGSHLAF